MLSSDAQGIGALKRAAVAAACSEWVVELDADDLLHPSALERVLEAGGDFVYSDFAEFQTNESRWPGYPYRGWHSYAVTFEGRELLAMRARPLTEKNLGSIGWAPNHLRAWRREAYDRVGGHDPALALADDYDLTLRMFLSGARFVHVPECLYFYRVHPDSTVKTQREALRAAADSVSLRYRTALSESFARRAPSLPRSSTRGRAFSWLDR